MADIRIEELKSLCMELLTKNSFRAKDAEVIVEHLVENECSGKASHGMVRLPEIISAIRKFGLSTEDPESVHDQGNISVLDAKGQIGVVAGYVATQQAISRAKEHGLAMVGIKNYIATSGSMAFYLRKFIEQGLIAIMGCNSVAMVAPPAGKQRMIGTNPVGIAIPGAEDKALVADLATSAIAYGKIMVMNDKGENVPEGVLIDKEGEPSTNPEDAYEGAILPLADHKGFSLGLMVELLAGPLIGAKAMKQNIYDGDGLFIIAIDPLQFGNSAYFEEIAESLADLKSSPTRPGYDTISIAGERSEKTLQMTLQQGKVEVAEKTLQDIRSLLEDIDHAAA